MATTLNDPVCAHCKRGGGVVACAWCGAWFHFTPQHGDRHGGLGPKCLEQHVQEVHGRRGAA